MKNIVFTKKLNGSKFNALGTINNFKRNRIRTNKRRTRKFHLNGKFCYYYSVMTKPSCFVWKSI